MDNVVHLTGYINEVQSLNGEIFYPKDLEGYLNISGELINASTDIRVQNKTVKSSIIKQIISADEGYNYLSHVIIDPIPYKETFNDFNGITVKIG